MRFYWLFLGILSVWRLTHLLAAEDGPWNLIARLRELAGTDFWKSLLDCFYCLSLWVSFPFALLIAKDGTKEIILLWLGLSAGAIALERLTTVYQPPPALYFEDNEREQVLQSEDQKISAGGIASAVTEQPSSQPNYDASTVVIQNVDEQFRLH